MTNPASLSPGAQVGTGRFTLVRELGRGGMGVVWLAHDTRLKEDVALKFLPPEIRTDPGALDDLRRETLRSRRLSHPNIVRIHDLHEAEGEPPFLSMEFVDGPNLLALRVAQAQRVFAWSQLQPWVRQLCAALDYAHGEKVIHRDLKPGNLMLDSQGRLKLADFGIAAVVSDSMSRVSVPRTSGTLAYMSPQQLEGRRAQATDDIYALGATLYELLTSKPPFHTGDLTHQILHVPATPLGERLAELELDNEVPADVAALVMACLAKEPAQRPQNAAAVAEWVGLNTEGEASGRGLTETTAAEEDASAAVTDKQPGIQRRSSSATRLLWSTGAVVVICIGALLTWVRSRHPGSLNLTREFTDAIQSTNQAPRGSALTQPTGQQLADLELDLSCVQGRSNWFYGYYRSPFTQSSFKNFEVCAGSYRWQHVTNLPSFPYVAGTMSSPGATEWAVTRWRSPIDGWITIRGTIRKALAETAADQDGVTGYIIISGKTVRVFLVRSGDTGGFLYQVAAVVTNGAPVDFALSPNTNPWMDTTIWTVKIDRGRAVDTPIATNDTSEGSIPSQPTELRFLSTSLPTADAGDRPTQPTRFPVNPEKRASARWTNSLGMVFVPVPGTEVKMCIWETRVRDFETFALATRFEGGNELAVLGPDGWQSRAGANWRKPPFPQEPAHPVIGITWDEARQFCQWLTANERAAGKLPANLEYRLPTDLEWDRAVGIESVGATPAARSGSVKGRYPWGTTWPPPDDAGNFAGREARVDWPADLPVIEGHRDPYPRTAPVGSFAPNAHGLHDLGGNVWEWCEDWYDAKQVERVVRGAAWPYYAQEVHLSSCRRGVNPTARGSGMGFRAVLAGTNSATVGAGGDWIMLFDGKSTDAWRGFNRQSFPSEGWVIESGALKSAAKPGAVDMPRLEREATWDLVSKAQFKDFILEFEWRTDAQADSGVYYSVANESKLLPSSGGVEMQIVGDAHRQAQIPNFATGAAANLFAPGPNRSVRPAGEYNSARIVMRRGQVEHWLNGQKIVDYVWGGQPMRDAYAKLSEPGRQFFAPKMDSYGGHIALQHAYSGTVWYRNVRIQPLTEN